MTLTNYATLKFIIGEKIAFFNDIVDILELNIVLDEVVEELRKVSVKQLRILWCLSWSVNTYDKLYNNFPDVSS